MIGEPFYDKLLDFAMEFFADEWGQVHFIGYSLFETDKRGVYKENLLAADRVIEERISTYVLRNLTSGWRRYRWNWRK